MYHVNKTNLKKRRCLTPDSVTEGEGTKTRGTQLWWERARAGDEETMIRTMRGADDGETKQQVDETGTG